MQLAVPLAALLLDYPIAYLPSFSNPHALSGSPLDFYECVLISGAHDCRNERKTHIIMKFSCPARLQDMGPEHFKPQSIISQLQEMFTKRLQLLEDPTLECHVIHTTQTLDHITFWDHMHNLIPIPLVQLLLHQSEYAYYRFVTDDTYSTSTLIIVISSYGLSILLVLTFSMVWTTSKPERTRPKIVCFLSSHGVALVVMKNWDPFVFAPALAMLTV